jgi:hypothetical protein
MTIVRLRDIPIWSAKWSTEALRRRRDDDERSYRRGFELVAMSDEEVSFPSFTKCYSHGVSVGEIARSGWIKVAGVDLSSRKRPGNSIVVLALHPTTGRRYPIDVRFGAWKSNETCEVISDLDRTYNLSVIAVEDNAYQTALIDWAVADKARFPWWMKVEPTTTTGQTKNSETLGLPSLQVEFSHGAWVVPIDEYEGAAAGEEGRRGMWARWDYEFRNHPLASTSDGVMATWFGRQALDAISRYVGAAAGAGQVGDLGAR